MPIREWLFEVPEKEKKEEEQPQSSFDIAYMKLSELAKRDMAIEIRSEILDCRIWLCSNEEMVSQIRKDDPEAITYTVEELRELIRLNPTPDDIKRIHDAKSVFKRAKITDSKLKGSSDEGHADSIRRE